MLEVLNRTENTAMHALVWISISYKSLDVFGFTCKSPNVFGTKIVDYWWGTPFTRAYTTNSILLNLFIVSNTFIHLSQPYAVICQHTFIHMYYIIILYILQMIQCKYKKNENKENNELTKHPSQQILNTQTYVRKSTQTRISNETAILCVPLRKHTHLEETIVICQQNGG